MRRRHAAFVAEMAFAVVAVQKINFAPNCISRGGPARRCVQVGEFRSATGSPRLTRLVMLNASTRSCSRVLREG